MRWDALFADLEAQSDALDRADRAAEVDDRSRSEFADHHLRDRLRACVGGVVRLRVAGGATIAGTVRKVGPDWLLIDEEASRECLVPLSAVMSVVGAGRWVADPAADSAVAARLGLRSALRAVARDRSGVRLLLVDGAALAATLDRVGADFVEAAVHPVGEARRRAAVQEVQLVAFAAIAAVRRDV